MASKAPFKNFSDTTTVGMIRRFSCMRPSVFLLSAILVLPGCASSSVGNPGHLSHKSLAHVANLERHHPAPVLGYSGFSGL